MLYISRKPVVVSVDSDWTALVDNDCTRVDSIPADKWACTEPGLRPRSQAGTPIDDMKLQTILYWDKAPPFGHKLGRWLRHKTFQSLW